MYRLTPLKRILMEDGRKQNWLAERVGIDEPRLSRIVGGKLHADEDTQEKIAAALGRKVSEVFGEPLQDAA
jgi:transcriptional regulator with XRE-family HTH domain